MLITMRKPSAEYTFERAATGVGRQAVVIVRAQAKIRRNDPCPCGSGQKYKRCHLLLEKEDR